VLDKHYGFRVPVVETKEHTLFLRKYETLVPPSAKIAEGVDNRSGASYLTRTVVIKLDKKYNPKDFFQKVTENELKMKGFEQVQ
jgi:hypothetical protein